MGNTGLSQHTTTEHNMTQHTMITHEQEQAIREWLIAHPTLSVGLGTEEQACSIAAINLALTGELTDTVPKCMSPAIGHWIIGIQDRMPDDVRNGAAWRDLLPLAAGTGRDHEPERVAIIMDWMWGTALPIVQSIADLHGFGPQWQTMCEQRTPDAARIAASAAIGTVYDYDDVRTDSVLYTAYTTADFVANAANYAYVRVDTECARVAYAVVSTTSTAVEWTNAWNILDPVGLLRRLIAVTDTRAA